MSQLPLEFRLEPHARFELFVTEAGGPMLDHLRDLARGRRSEIVWLAGLAGSGKTHLLQAACRAAGDAALRTMYLDAGDGLPPGALDNLGGLDLLAIDDVNDLAGNPEAERALFAVANDFYRGGGVLIMAAATVPAAAGFQLPDLASRAAGATVYRLKPLSDRGCDAAIGQLARARGLVLDPAAAGYLLSRVRRDMRAIVAWLDLIDRETLASSRRRVTVPFVRDLLARYGAAAGLQLGRDSR